ncbi:MAG TPA: TadE family protein [Actinomycetota bacterium]|nr:TadE family protein [Actinomycetota bacterium]
MPASWAFVLTRSPQIRGSRCRAFEEKRQILHRGSASVEFSVVAPLVAIAMLVVVQVSLLAWDQMRVAHAAREGARALALANDASAAEEAALEAGRLERERAGIEIAPEARPAGTAARVTVVYRPRMLVPFVGRYAPEVTLNATVWMRVERDPP